MKKIKPLRSGEWWRAWKDFERGARKWRSGTELQTIARLCRVSKQKSVLEVGAGVGRVALKLAPRCGKLVALEADAGALKELRSLTRNKKNATVVAGDLHSLPFKDGSFDCVYSAWVLQSSKIDRKRAVAEQARVLRRGGRFVAVTENERGDDAALKELLGRKGDRKKRVLILQEIKALLKKNGLKNVRGERSMVRFEFPYSLKRTGEALRFVVMGGEELDARKRKKLEKFLEKRRKGSRIIFTQGASFISAAK